MTLVEIERERLKSDKEYRNEFKFRCQTDHLFLASVLGYKLFVERVHRPVADLYVQKKPGLPLPEQDTVKFRLHLDPRDTYKSTFGIVDTVQWILVEPDVTIVNETATQPLAEEMTNTAVDRAFLQPKDKEPTLLQIAFPEHVVTRHNSGEYNSPARTFAQPDKTINSTSVSTTQSGWHPWIFNPDDPVDTENSGINATAKVRQRVISNHNTNMNMLRRGGYMHMRGTRYHPFELWGETLDKMDPAEWKILIRSALRVKSGRRLEMGDFPAREEVELTFPELMTYEELRTKFNRDYVAFMCQQMNDPQGGATSVFPVELFGQALIEPDKIPAYGDNFMFWRFPFAGKDFMKYAEGVVMRISHGHAYQLDAWQGNYTPTGLAEKVVKECQRHQVWKVTGEDSPGARYLESHIKNESYKKNVSIQVDWTPFEDDDNERFMRIEQLEPMMRSGRLSLSTGSGKASEIKRQFIHFRLIQENGIIDSISRLALKLPVSLLRTELDEEEMEAQRKRRRQLESDMVFGSAGVAAMEEQQRQQRMMNALSANRNSYGLPDCLGGLDG